MAEAWFRAVESKKGRTAHLKGHRRLGLGHSKCGKLLGGKATVWSAECQVCLKEVAKEQEPQPEGMTGLPPSIWNRLTVGLCKSCLTNSGHLTVLLDGECRECSCAHLKAWGQF